MFKQVSLTLLIILCAASAFGQKIKHKKGQILVDKVHTFNFTKTSGKGEAFAYTMTDLNGDTLLKFSDREMTLIQLPYERVARTGAKHCRVEAPSLGGKVGIINPISLSYASRFLYNAKKTGFLTATGLNADNWDAYLEYSGTEQFNDEFAKVEAANAVRVENSTKSTERFGEFSSRGSGDVYLREDKIIVAAVTIGKLKKAAAVRKDHIIYFINSENGEHVIGKILQKPGSQTYSIHTSIDGGSRDFKIFTSITGVVQPLQHGLNYLVDHGYL